MFTGIIEEVGRVENINRTNVDSLKLSISSNKIIESLSLGNSIAVNGVCLTVVGKSNSTFVVDVMPETVNKTNIIDFKKGSMVNLERAINVSDRMAGHFVLGHIDGIGTINKKERIGNSSVLRINTSSDITKYVVQKGSIAIDGISLTVVEEDNKSFAVSIIPFTLQNTTLGFKNIGDKVNIEVDIIGKYIYKLLNGKENNSNITMEFLKKYGY